MLRLQRGRRRPDLERAWSGVRIADVLAEARRPRRTPTRCCRRSADGWTAGTPLTALTDDRDAMFAVAMNGEPLTPEHGFPVRMVVPGLYGYVSATKWVVDLEVTRFDRFTAFWTDRGWSAEGSDQDRVADRRARQRAPVVAGRRRSPASPGRSTPASTRSRCRSATTTGSPCELGATSRPSTAGGSGRTGGTPSPAATRSRCGPPTRRGYTQTEDRGRRRPRRSHRLAHDLRRRQLISPRSRHVGQVSARSPGSSAPTVVRGRARCGSSRCPRRCPARPLCRAPTDRASDEGPPRCAASEGAAAGR